MKIKRNKVVEIYNVLSEFKGTLTKIFSMYLILNLKKLKLLVEDIETIYNSTAPSQEYIELQKKELEILNKYVARDEDNKPIQVAENQFKLKDNVQQEYLKELEEFKKENKDIIDEFNKNKKHVENLLEEEIDVDIIEIPFEVIPEEIDVDKLEVLSQIIKDFGNIE